MLKKKNLMAFVDSDKQTQFVAGLIVSLCAFILFWEFSKKRFNDRKLLLFRIGFCLTFLVFCINIYTIFAISKHLSTIYDMLTVENEQEVYDYHMDKSDKLNIITMIFRFSLVLLIFAVFMILISKHDIVNHYMLLFLIVISTGTIVALQF